jgi:peptide chain release factor 2
MGSRRNRPPAGTGPLVRSPQRSQAPVLDLTDFKRDLSELTDRLGHAQDCL